MPRSPLIFGGPLAVRKTAMLLGLAALLLGAFCVTTASTAEAKSTKLVELGGRNIDRLEPNCGRDFSRDCIVEGKVTAYQALSGFSPGRNFVVPFKGKLIAWSISLARPTRVDVDEYQAQLPAFNDIFGAPSRAGISILRRVQKRKKGAPRFKLVRRSRIKVLNPYFGTTVTFALEKPMNVFKGNIVALTVPTWAPMLWRPRACNFDPSYGSLNPDRCARAEKMFTWRGSRVLRDETCELANVPEPNEQLQKTRPHQVIDSVRRYGCYYGGNVLLYSATIVGR